jgi:hypothetical protein
VIDKFVFLLPMTLGIVPIAFVLAHPFSRTTLYARIAARRVQAPISRAEALRRQQQGIYLQMGDFHYRTEHRD